MKKTAIAFAVIMMATVEAQAGKIASSVAAHSAGQDQIVCYVFNADKDDVTIRNVDLVDGRGDIVEPTQDTCAAAGDLAPYESCFALSTEINPGLPHACVVTYRGRADVRGLLEIRENGIVRQNTPLF